MDRYFFAAGGIISEKDTLESAGASRDLWCIIKAEEVVVVRNGK